MTCNQVKNNLFVYLDNSIDEKSKQEFEIHINECAECREELQTYQQLQSMLHSVEEIEPSSSYKEHFWSSVGVKGLIMSFLRGRTLIYALAACLVILITLALVIPLIVPTGPTIEVTTTGLTDTDRKDEAFMNEMVIFIESPIIDSSLMFTDEELQVLTGNDITQQKKKQENNKGVNLQFLTTNRQEVNNV
ncbi:MAG: hypothetical protein A2Y62_21140 [Candidatus Fischerbacteria bacterium RBG_13_37_8]|uniref:Putative zinc-finger domain-containing protein n=1 Tax=Candidatus Fischerbacteria bacterium RBG_13_37_8 TaxID=1817863 RepID=A0A1F5V6E1_9BACT|nr:MAG: hypothetical protein A2Y62_21140 [Candidatus Fischerbacteria bacterium RBG_13_37_8]